MGVRNLEDLGMNLRLIAERLLANQNLCKLLYYTDYDPLSQPDLVNTKSLLLHNLIRIIPVIGVKETANSIIGIRVRNGYKNGNPEFKNILIDIQVVTPMTQWPMKSENLRPFLTLGEIQKSLAGKTVNGLGKLEGGDFTLEYLTELVSCYSMKFEIVAYD